MKVWGNERCRDLGYADISFHSLSIFVDKEKGVMWWITDVYPFIVCLSSSTDLTVSHRSILFSIRLGSSPFTLPVDGSGLCCVLTIVHIGSGEKRSKLSSFSLQFSSSSKVQSQGFVVPQSYLQESPSCILYAKPLSYRSG